MSIVDELKQKNARPSGNQPPPPGCTLSPARLAKIERELSALRQSVSSLPTSAQQERGEKRLLAALKKENARNIKARMTDILTGATIPAVLLILHLLVK